jgi:hypothetical protein
MEVVLIVGGVILAFLVLYASMEEQWFLLVFSVIFAILLAVLGIFLYYQPDIIKTDSVVISDRLIVNDRSNSEVIRFSEPVKITKIVSHKPYFLTTYIVYEVDLLK